MTSNAKSETSATVQILDGAGLPLRLKTWPLAETLAAGEVVVRIELAIICLSDLQMTRGVRTRGRETA
jgi:D-arabinose 1-dehydrogenase-like Zn-dependent alcohol dehydrogenase